MLENKVVIVTGATGFLGRHVCSLLMKMGAKVNELNSKTWDMRKFPNDYVLGLFENADYVIHLAGLNGGIQFNQEHKCDIFLQNTLMGFNLLSTCVHFNKIKKVLSTVTSCGYPQHHNHLIEYNYIDDKPHRTVSCHGYAKRNIVLATDMFRETYGVPAITVCPTTLYGPGDKTDPIRSKVVGALITRFIIAKRENAESVTLWGTGKAQREIMYVEDAAKYLLVALEKYNTSCYPINIGSEQEFTIAELADKISNLVGYKGKILWDNTKPDGQMRKKLSTYLQYEILGKMQLTDADEGLRKTIAWQETQI
jgi:GDP-L-fucose synthase